MLGSSMSRSREGKELRKLARTAAWEPIEEVAELAANKAAEKAMGRFNTALEEHDGRIAVKMTVREARLTEMEKKATASPRATASTITASSSATTCSFAVLYSSTRATPPDTRGQQQWNPSVVALKCWGADLHDPIVRTREVLTHNEIKEMFNTVLGQ
eukprot:TRINITY_DN44043_c0_g1_i1.p1 TRINITY_DN44043_c0_g1~~TRINITY_DN44043_c0_g1_i1.p1  ORF type:complete len:176 (+),score=35.54 TRINITY_DN44043_c0_g1_i1:57-530(+)